MKTQDEKKILIIGAGFAGLAAGIYARLNGYKADIYEMHDLPGGLCTSWKRKGYTFDSCIHWLVGSSPESGMHDLWEETGIAAGRKFIDMDQYLRMEDKDGRTLILYTDVDRLEKHLLEFSPADEVPIRRFTEGIRMCLGFDAVSKHDSLFRKIRKLGGTSLTFMLNAKKFRSWMNTTCGSFASEFSDPLIREAIREMWLPDFSMLFMLFTFAYLHNRNAGYPIGGSLPMSKALEARFLELGGNISYRSRVKDIITENNIASGIRLTDGTEISGDIVISAADGYSTIFGMLGGRYADEKTREPYSKWPLFPSLIFVSLGVKRTFAELPLMISGLTFFLKEPVVIGDKKRERLTAHIYNHDPSMAPEGSTAITVMLDTNHDYWKELAENRQIYLEKKDEISKQVIAALGERFPGLPDQVEAVDVATPMTFIRYTGNWKGSFEGWLITPENAGVVMKPMAQDLPGLGNFYLCGQWVEPGGGLPTAIMSARRLFKTICKKEGRKFRS
jgi:phytoene dehydrogenase-like protein